MNDPLRKPRKLRFKVGRALLVSAPLVGSLACGEPQISVNPGPEPNPPPPEVNVPAMEEPPVELRPIESTNVTEEQALGQEKPEEVEIIRRPPTMNPGPRPRPTMVNPGPQDLEPPLHDLEHDD